jgi:hypothetical protein
MPNQAPFDAQVFDGATAEGQAVDLITGTFALQALGAGGVSLSDYQQQILPVLITAASREIARFCARVFALTTYDEIVSIVGGRQERGEPATARLSGFPVASVSRCNTGRSTVLSIANTDRSTNQFATAAFATTGDVEYLDLVVTGLVLSRTAGGVTTPATLSYSDYATVAALAAAINALGGGWSATVASGTPSPGLYAPAELVGAREPKNAFSPGVGLDVFTTPASGYDIDRPAGIMRCYGDPGGWAGVLGDPSFGSSADGFGGYGGGPARGDAQYRVTYQAGFAVIPESIQLVCAEVVQLMFGRLATDSALKSETADRYSWTARDAVANLSDGARQTLTLYKDGWL